MCFPGDHSLGTLRVWVWTEGYWFEFNQQDLDHPFSQTMSWRLMTSPRRRAYLCGNYTTHVSISEHQVFKHCFAGLVTCVDFSKQNLLCATTTRPEDGIYVLDVPNGKRLQVHLGVASEGCRCGFHRELVELINLTQSGRCWGFHLPH